MACKKGDVVLVTGASGFLGQHILKQLQRDATVSEIRALDKVPLDDYSIVGSCGDDYCSKINFFINNLLDVEECRSVFLNTDIVIHCAALVSYDFPPNYEELQKNNVDATENVIHLCIEQNVQRLIYCSTTEVTLTSYVKYGMIAIVIYQQESKVGVPEDERRLMMGAYAISKLRAEKIVLKANGQFLSNGTEKLKTVSIRPTILYGDGDTTFISRILKYGKSRGNILPRIGGKGGKQQMTYVGNAAWGFICAKNTLRDRPDSIAGLPVIITDDNDVNDIGRFCERITTKSDNYIKRSSWWIPLPISYTIALFIEFIMNVSNKFIGKLPISPTSLISYLGSVFLYNRSRAAIHLDYSPIYSSHESMELSRKYYQSLLTH
ncbi:3 beta-hydroxysteroid dehydrogenase/Delta 5--_4-isomerase type 1 [Fopius arisanus]|uniref:3 beta-hydroxysteroid dehydrogenase/Delta 5-->4-isomerase type 1 n=1 Tax=Fopius arisanus TaxID=64838 RepID=A0A9R1SYR3_9HYME|nr:PREDICTED: 3 beta-hydroxysteroid dehydrogenase/Delta 5-->4-isomerase type 1 [Fopius arisanus]